MDMWKGKGKMECRRTLVRQTNTTGLDKAAPLYQAFLCFPSFRVLLSLHCLPFCILVTGEHQYGSWTVDRMWSYWDAGVLPEALT